MPTPIITTMSIVAVTTTAVAPKLNGHAVLAETNNEFAHISLPDLIGQSLTDGKIICPFHDDRTPSLHVYADHFHCYACGARGDHVDWLMFIERMTRDEATKMLAAWDGPRIKPQIAKDDEEIRRVLNGALKIWNAAKPIANTLAIKYLADIRGVDTDALPTNDAALLFHPRCPFGPGVEAPCLVALYRDVSTDQPAGIHRIALTDDVFAGAKVRRMTLGQWPTPRAIKIWPATEQLFLGEGVETVLAAGTRLQYRDAPMRPAWAAGSSSNITKFPVLADVRRLTLLVDHDEAGKNSTNDCRLRWREAGRDVARLLPKRAGADFNAVVLDQRQQVAS
jgi:hypothetical protein